MSGPGGRSHEYKVREAVCVRACFFGERVWWRASRVCARTPSRAAPIARYLPFSGFVCSDRGRRGRGRAPTSPRLPLDRLFVSSARTQLARSLNDAAHTQPTTQTKTPGPRDSLHHHLGHRRRLHRPRVWLWCASVCVDGGSQAGVELSLSRPPPCAAAALSSRLEGTAAANQCTPSPHTRRPQRHTPTTPKTSASAAASP